MTTPSHPEREALLWRLHKFLDAAAGEGFELAGVDAAELFTDLFDEGGIAALESRTPPTPPEGAADREALPARPVPDVKSHQVDSTMRQYVLHTHSTDQLVDYGLACYRAALQSAAASPRETPAGLTDERAAFLNWSKSITTEQRYDFDSEGRGYKKDAGTMMWLAWQGRAALSPQGVEHPSTPTETCAWHSDEDGLWQMACGGDPWVFEDGGVVENRVKHCMHCGKPVALAASPTPSEGENHAG